ncbi:helix-turn-helix domain-containing protein [Streptomyces sp. NPDC019890]|uniref:helix-turn-helix domain-containing protein n=1 Tax=Streptomyces sp. NPDC019890 TaxID=3365064 RepID=UPI00384C7246
MSDRVRTCRGCRCRLSQYNRDDLCGPCSRRAPSVQDSPRVPSWVWLDVPVQIALEERDYGRACKLIRKHSGLRQVDMAGLAGTSQGFLSMLESGNRRLTSIERVTRFLDGLGVPAELRTATGRQPSQLATPTLLTPPTTAAATAEGTLNPTELRALASQAAAQSLQFAERVGPSNVTGDDIEDLAYELARIATDYVHAPLQPLFSDLLAARNGAFSLLDGRQDPGQTRDLFLLAGTSCLLLAHASQNLGDERSAMAQIRTAWTCAQKADHSGLRAWAKGTAALIAEWSPRKQAALNYTQQALGYAPAGESRIRIAAIEARGAARIGDRERALAALTDLQRARDQQSGPGGLGQFGGLLTFPLAKQEYYIGGTYALLGEHAQAEEHATAAIALYEGGAKEDRSYGDEALARLDITTARLAVGEVEGAGEQLQQILQMPPNLRIQQIDSAMKGVGDLLKQPRLAGSRLARELADATRDYQAIDPTTKA